MSLIAFAASSSISPPSVPSTSRDGSSASGRSPVGPSVAGMPATLNGSSNTETALPCTVVEQAVTSSAEQTASTAPTRCRRLMAAAFRCHQRPVGAQDFASQDSAERPSRRSLQVRVRALARDPRPRSVVAQNGGSDARR